MRVNPFQETSTNLKPIGGGKATTSKEIRVSPLENTFQFVVRVEVISQNQAERQSAQGKLRMVEPMASIVSDRQLAEGNKENGKGMDGGAGDVMEVDLESESTRGSSRASHVKKSVTLGGIGDPSKPELILTEGIASTGKVFMEDLGA